MKKHMLRMRTLLMIYNNKERMWYFIIGFSLKNEQLQLHVHINRIKLLR